MKVIRLQEFLTEKEIELVCLAVKEKVEHAVTTQLGSNAQSGTYHVFTPCGCKWCSLYQKVRSL